MTTLDAIMRAVAARYEVPIEELTGERTTRHVSRARHIAIWLALREGTRSRPEIGAAFNRDHTSVTHAALNVWQWVTDDVGFAAEMAELLERLRSDAPPPAAVERAVAELDAAIAALERARVDLIHAHAPPLKGTPRERMDRDAQLIRAAAQERGRRARANRPPRLPAEGASSDA